MSEIQNTQLTPAMGYNPTNNMIFSDPIYGSIPDSRPKIEFRRINISTRNEDGSIGELIIPTERLYSFGISTNTSQETGKVTGYTLPLCLWNRDNPTEKEKIWVETFDNIVDCCIDHLVENREEIELYELSRSDLTKSKGGLNPLYWKKEKFTEDSGKTILRKIPGRGPTLYSKLIYSKKHDKFLTQFFDTNDEPIEARTLMGKHCYATSAIKIESIFIGAKISLQVKVYESVVEPVNSGMKRLLARPVARSKVLAIENERKSDSVSLMEQNDSDSDSDGSLLGESENTAAVSLKSTKNKKVVKKVRRKRKN